MQEVRVTVDDNSYEMMQRAERLLGKESDHEMVMWWIQITNESLEEALEELREGKSKEVQEE